MIVGRDRDVLKSDRGELKDLESNFTPLQTLSISHSLPFSLLPLSTGSVGLYKIVPQTAPVEP